RLSRSTSMSTSPTPRTPSLLFHSAPPPLALHPFPTRRSSDLQGVAAAAGGARLQRDDHEPDARLLLGVAARRRPGGRRRSRGQQDRKSTRLNSSHVAISYAVFCLKKKKKTSTMETGYHTKPR